MRRHRRTSATDDSGHDSFLDIVANLVGILVILIMVVGVRARNAYRTTKVDPVMSSAEGTPIPSARPDSLESLKNQVGEKQTEIQEIQRDTFRLDAKMRQISHQAEFRESQRDQLQLLVSAATADIEQRRAALSDVDRSRNETTEHIAAAKHELRQIELATEAVNAATPGQPKLLQHFPTPLSKMVFGREEHFRLMDHRLVYVPINAIVEHVTADAKKKMWKLKDASEVSETIGPVGGFNVQYTMYNGERRTKTEFGTSLFKSIELERFTLVPLGDRMGKPLAEAIAEGSEFASFMSTLDPSDTTITVWVYPDSFDEYRQLKDVLHAMGFQAAARPMPVGQQIGGGQGGTRSNAE